MFSVLSKTGANLHHFSIYCIASRRFLYFFKLFDSPFSRHCNVVFATSLGKNCALVRPQKFLRFVTFVTIRQPFLRSSIIGVGKITVVFGVLFTTIIIYLFIYIHISIPAVCEKCSVICHNCHTPSGKFFVPLQTVWKKSDLT